MRRTLYGADKATRMAARYIPKDARCILEHENGSALYSYESGGKFLVIAFWGTSARNLFHFSYRTDEARQQKILEFKASVESSITRRQTRRAEKIAWTNPLKVGDLLYTSWGYDQTNTEFYAVTRVSGKRVWIRQIASDYEGTGFMSGKSWPAMPIRFCGEETMHTAQPAGEGRASIKIGHHYAWQETGREHYTSSYA